MRLPRLVWLAALLGCGRAQPSADPTAAFLRRVLSGDRPSLLAAFAGSPQVDDPMAGRVVGDEAFDRFLAQRRAWLAERGASVESLRVTQDEWHTVAEAVLHLRLPDTTVDLPIAVVGDRAPGSKVTALRIYHSHWPLLGAHRVRAPLLPPDTTLVIRDVVGVYQRALAAGQVDSIVDAFAPDGYFREPSGGNYVHRGRDAVRTFFTALLSSGGIGIDHCTLTDDGTVAAIEFIAVRFGAQRLVPQAGLAVYERAPGGRLRGARIYDDVNVEVLAPATVPE